MDSIKPFKYKRVAAVLRGQPVHLGHIRMIDLMLELGEQVFLVIGSTQEQGTEKNPFPYVSRKKQILNIYGSDPAHVAKKSRDRIRIVGLPDINNSDAWGDYFYEFIEQEMDGNKLDAYFCGTKFDAHWYERPGVKIEVVDRSDTNHPFVSATMLRHMFLYEDVRWKQFIPACNHAIVQEHIDRTKWKRR